jgi:diguanylate cyclase
MVNPPGATAGIPARLRLRLRLLLLGVISGAILTVAASLYRLVAAPPPEPTPAMRSGQVIVFIALVLSANRSPLRIHFRTNRMPHVWDEVALVMGLAFLPAPDLLVATWVGCVLAHVSAGRGVAKSLYNAGVATLGTLAAVVIVGRLGAYPPLGASARVIVLLVAASLGYSLINDLAISAVVSGTQRASLWPVLREDFWVNQGLCLTSGLAGIGFLMITGDHLETLLALPIVVLGLHGAQAAALRVAQEREAWERLDLATRELNQLNHAAVLDTAVTRAIDLFRCDGVELLLERAGPGIIKLTSVGAMGDLQPPDVNGRGDSERPAGPERPGSVVSRVLAGSGVRVGELRLYYARPVVLSERESWALSTFSHAVTAALLNASLYEELQEHANRKSHEAAHDALTGLANRTVLTGRGGELLDAAVRQHNRVALFLVDLDHFKQVNDSYGHDVGDALLRETSRRLVAGVRPSDLVVRLGGDEFALVLPDLAADADLAAANASVCAALAGSVTVAGIDIDLAASIGVACAPMDGVTVPELLRCADAAMYRAKTAARSVDGHRSTGQQAERPAQWRGGPGRRRLVSELHPSLHRGELELQFQPKVDLRTGAAYGAEALARWRTPTGKLLDASDFMPVVEASDVVGGFARQVLDLALAAAAQWSVDRGTATVAVNLSARDLLDRSLPGDVAAALDRHAVDPTRLILEITETMMLSQLDVVYQVLTELRRLGAQLSVDDFGTGFSSLTFLSHVDVDELKIDQSFVARMLGNPVDATIVATLLDLGRRLGLRVVAEGVENGPQRDHLLAMGCESAQGYFLGPPMSASDLARVLSLRYAETPQPVRSQFIPMGRG